VINRRIIVIIATTTTALVATGGCGPKITAVSPAIQETQQGCKSCHANLSETFPKNHVNISPEEVKYCLMCHFAGGKATAFEWIAHFKHYSAAGFMGDCWSCHVINVGGGFQLIGVENVNEINLKKDMIEKIDAYLRSWATSEHLDHRHAQNSVTCRPCHGTFSSEGRVSMEQCLRCHGTYQYIATMTKDVDPNPHDSHLGEIDCTLCHRAHKDSEDFCAQCHPYEFKVP